ncbi:MAG: hypothetical protein HY741_27065 [Chloroflexi bacterium]|nr:hypothetical protein [Chloroflexota bacterium]
METLTCQACGQRFLPRFYCPDAKVESRHAFVPSSILVDNAGAVYTFCPEHTFTTYALVTDEKPRPQPVLLDTLLRRLDSFAFRLAIEIEGLRWRFFSRQ